MIDLNAITIDTALQIRAAINTETVNEYADAMRAGAVFPPIVVFEDGGECILVDGFHRIEAYRAAGITTIPADILPGTRRDALLYAVGANASHGLRRTNADKRRAVEVLLTDDEWSQWSNTEIARRAGVDEKMVRSLRPSSEKPKIRKASRGGKTYDMRVEHVGKKTITPADEAHNPIVEVDSVLESANELYDTIMRRLGRLKPKAQGKALRHLRAKLHEVERSL